MKVALATAPQIPVSDQDDTPLLDALVERGVDAALVGWRDEHADWASFDGVVIRSVWDYTEDRDAFVAWAAEVGAATRLFNSADVVRWNTHKSYLIELEERGAPVVPTAWLGRGDRIRLADLAASRRWRELVVKPAVGAGSEGLLITDDPDAGQAHLDDLLERGDAMVQPFLAATVEHGELSIVCVDGRVSHAIRKRPADGDRRVQIEFGGRYDEVVVDDDTAALAEWVVESTGHDLLFARVDLLPADDGTWQLSELEATEPSLYLDRVDGAAGRLADALIARLQA